MLSIATNLFNLTGNYYPGVPGNVNRIKEYISKTEPWIMFPHASIKSKEFGVNAPYPNLYVNSPDGSKFCLGIVLSNYGAMEWIHEFSQPCNVKQKIKIEKLISSLPPSYKWALEIRSRSGRNMTEAIEEGPTSEINISKFSDMIKEQTSICKKKTKKCKTSVVKKAGKKIVWEAPAFSLAYIWVDGVNDLNKEFIRLFDVLLTIFSIKIGKEASKANMELEKKKLEALSSLDLARKFPDKKDVFIRKYKKIAEDLLCRYSYDISKDLSDFQKRILG